MLALVKQNNVVSAYLNNFDGRSEITHAIDSIFKRYDDDKNDIIEISKLLENKSTAIKCFLEGSKTSSYLAESMFDLKKAIPVLNSKYWSEVLEKIEILDAMPAQKKNKWQEDLYQNKTPDFTKDNVYASLDDLLSKRAGFFAEKVDGVFKRLSKTHKTNSMAGFREKLIIGRIVDKSFGYYSTNHNGCEYLNDFRSVVAQVLNKSCDSVRSYSIISDMVKEEMFGEWVTFDAGAFELKIFKSGTAHIKVHEDVACKLNKVLSSIYPNILPEERPTEVKKSKSYKPLRKDDLSYEVRKELDIINNGNGFEIYIYKLNNINKYHKEQIRYVLTHIGGIESKDKFSFSYDVRPVLAGIIRSGLLPERKSFQFYPTPKKLAEIVFELADLNENETILEPSAGRGDLLNGFNSKYLKCVEISDLHASILKEKGYDVTVTDFLNYSEKSKFDKIIMNPPYAEGQARDHVLKASKIFKNKLVAILPASLKNHNFGESFDHEYSEIIEDAFIEEGTSVRVVILTLTCR